ncbi:MAG: hypothetical protein AB1486_30830, partial [Planctomycetota bacterium]
RSLRPARPPAGKRVAAIVLTAVALAADSGSAQTTWYVDDNACPGPGSGTAADPFCKIQDSIDAAARGDTVLVLPGTYLECIALVSMGITLRSDADGDPATLDIAPEATIIDGQQLGSVVTFTSTSELEDSLLEGFTISTLTFTTRGLPAFHVWLFAGTQPGAACLGRFGALFLDFSSPWLVRFWGWIPYSGRFDVTVAIPGTILSPVPSGEPPCEPRPVGLVAT